MNDAQKQALLRALKIYIPIAAPVIDDIELELLEQVVEELKAPTNEEEELDDTL
jgi:hypothetical protein